MPNTKVNLEKNNKDFTNESEFDNMNDRDNNSFDLESMSSSTSTVVEKEIVSKEDIKPLLTSYQRYFMLLLAVLGGFYSSLRRAYYVPYDEAFRTILE